MVTLCSRRRWATAPAVLVAAVLGGCTGTPAALAAPDYDRPVAADVPRAELRVAVDLEPSQDCEESFDLALYADRGIDLVSWDDAVGRCVGREVTIRFLTKSLSRAEVLEKVKGLARRTSEAPVAPASQGAPHGDS
jgi:hypothetical protein